MPIPNLTFEEALERAYRSRPDYQAALERVKAAEAARAAIGRIAAVDARERRLRRDRAARAELPRHVRHRRRAQRADFPGRTRQGTTDRGRRRSPNRRAEADDLKAGIYYDVKTAFMDLQASSEQLQVATRAREVATTALTQSRDRFAAGVTSNIEVVQAQEAVSRRQRADTSTRCIRTTSRRPCSPAISASRSRPFDGISEALADGRAGSRSTGQPRFRILIAVLIASSPASASGCGRTAGRETTDDAQVDAHVMQISARVGGTVLRVPVNDNQLVEAGATLVEIDPRDYQVAVDKARAELPDAEAAAKAAQSNVPITSTTATSDVTTAQSAVDRRTRPSTRPRRASRPRGRGSRPRSPGCAKPRPTPPEPRATSNA